MTQAKGKASAANARMDNLLYKRLLPAFSRIPPRLAVPLSRQLARVIAPTRLFEAQRLQAERNVRRLMPQLHSNEAVREAAVRVLANYLLYWYELYRLPRQIDRLSSFHTGSGIGLLKQARQQGPGAIVALPHLGNWESGGAWLIHYQGIPLTVIAERQTAQLEQWFYSLRSQLDMEVIYSDTSNVSRQIKTALANQRVVCLPCDRDFTGDGVEVSFFGEATTLPRGPAFLALRHGVPLLTAGVYRQGTHNIHVVMQPPLVVERSGHLRADVQRVTQAIAQRFEKLILEAPEQWLALQPIWPSDRNIGPPEGFGG